MSEPVAKSKDPLVVQLTVEELRALVVDVVRTELSARIGNGSRRLLTVEEAAEFLGYSKDWLYKHWRKVGGKRIGGRGVRFDAADLESWIKSRGS
jgi:excisionase family DNA binding protein